MKPALLIAITCLLVASCNDNNPFASKDKKTNDNATTQETREDGNKGGLFGRGGGKTGDNTTSNWTSDQRQQWLNLCMQDFDDKNEGRKVCSCVIDKLEKKYPNAKDVESATEEEGNQLIASCKTGLGNDPGGITGDDDAGEGGRTSTETGGNWTELQRQTYIRGCVGTAKQQPGMTLQKATSYCECMTAKVEQAYSFDKAARLTSKDLSTPEWTRSIQECLTGTNQ